MITNEKVWRPDNLHDAWILSSKLSDQCCFVSGGTWLRTQWEAGTKEMAPHLISLDKVPEVKEDISLKGQLGQEEVVIGASTTLAEMITNPTLNEKAPVLVKACKNIAGPSIRNQGTIGGNILSCVGDAIPALIVLNAKLMWFNGDELVYQSIEEWLLNQDEVRDILVSIHIPTDKSKGEHYEFAFYTKVGRRESFIPSLVTVAGTGCYRKGEGIFSHVSLSVGGGNVVPIRLPNTEVKIINNEYSSELLYNVLRQVQQDYKPIDDAFGSAAYKRKVAGNLIVSELYRIGGSNHALE
ncbi:xanthine dehydrogenase [Salipaludibacillus keqinensis]|uniref:Xanthine dehydrogenase n=1 Tax=Salipaludibacillus keqinensis TaxID=2045207 RepID=A0A323TQH0_9BACI|nr:FAD binding domain-containing protein [Salipaludibacillus keqinensis]PYZ94743.1 xanthine dehydrogenase [Salipaludibacillus keqinensis]